MTKPEAIELALAELKQIPLSGQPPIKFVWLLERADRLIELDRLQDEIADQGLSHPQIISALYEL